MKINVPTISRFIFVLLAIAVTVTQTTQGESILSTFFGMDNAIFAKMLFLGASGNPLFQPEATAKAFIEANRPKTTAFFAETYGTSFTLSELGGYDYPSIHRYMEDLEMRPPAALLGRYGPFLIDFARVFIAQGSLSEKLDTLFNKETGGTYRFFDLALETREIPIPFVYITDGFVFYQPGRPAEQSLYQMMYEIFKNRYGITTLLPKALTLNKNERAKFAGNFGYPFLYPEFESILEHLFILYCINAKEAAIRQATGMNLTPIIQAELFWVKYSPYNAIFKHWDSLENDSFFKFSKPYGADLLSFLPDKSIPETKVLIKMEAPVTAVVYVAPEFKATNGDLNRLEKYLLKKGFAKVLWSWEYEKSPFAYADIRKIFVSFMAENSIPTFSSGIAVEKKDVLYVNDVGFPRYDEILTVSFKEQVGMTAISKTGSLLSLMRSAHYLGKGITGHYSVIKRNWLEKIVDFVRYSMLHSL